jgi:hypothetical protein
LLGDFFQVVVCLLTMDPIKRHIEGCDISVNFRVVAFDLNLDVLTDDADRAINCNRSRTHFAADSNKATNIKG